MATATSMISREDFALRAIEKLRKPGWKGIHTVYSGFNAAWREYYGTDPVVGTKRLVEQGKLSSTPARGGAMIYLPKGKEDASTGTLKKMGL